MNVILQQPSAGVSIANASNFDTTATLPSDGTYIFTWTISDDTGVCDPTTDDIEITIASDATASASVANLDNCADSVDLEGIISTGATPEWTYVSGPGGFTINTPMNEDTTVDFTVSGTYVFKLTASVGDCSTAESEVTVNVGIPVSTAIAGPDQEICNATSVVMNADITGFDASTEIGTWSVLSGAPSNPTISDATDPNINITGLTTGIYTFVWTVNGFGNALCPSSSDEVVVEVYAPANAGSDQAICDVTTVILEGTENSTGTWSLIPADPSVTIQQSIGDGSNNGSVANVTGLTTGSYTFQYQTDIYTFGSGTTCTDTDTVVVEVSEKPSSDPDAGVDQFICTADTTIVTLNGNAVPANANGEWEITFPASTTAYLVNETSPNATVEGLTVPGIYYVEWTFSNGSCVKLADPMRIEVYAEPDAEAGVDQLTACQSDFLTGADVPK